MRTLSAATEEAMNKVGSGKRSRRGRDNDGEADVHPFKVGDIKKFEERISRVMEEQATLADDLKDIYAEAEAAGFNKKALKEAVRIKRKSVDKSHMARVNTYLEALDELPLFSLSGTGTAH